MPEAVITACIEAAGNRPFGRQPPALALCRHCRPGDEGPHSCGRRGRGARVLCRGAGDEWLAALEPIGTGVEKPHLTDAPWLIVVFAQRWGVTGDGARYKNYYVPESVGIATGMLITALHHAGLVCLEHTPNPMKFLAEMCGRPASEKAGDDPAGGLSGRRRDSAGGGEAEKAAG